MKQLDCAFDFTMRVDLTLEATNEPATGYTDVELRLSTTRGGAAIHASLAGTATESTEVPGRYEVPADVADLQANLLPDYLRQLVYLVVEKPGAIETKSYPYRVVQSQ
jgi:hypothetical protein